jgi:hypothetical protein
VPDVFVRIVQHSNNLHLSSYSEASTKDVCIFLYNLVSILALDMVTKIICPLFQIGPDNYMFEEGRRSIPTQPLQMAANSGKET